jgi:EAL domain-containing protein (putative c-di-GMP-specific phosphodiesterase class I)
VNLSIRQLQQEDLVGEVAQLLHDTGVAPYRLTLEITESLLVEEVPRVAERLDQLKDLGVRLAIDDFGTGYSTLSRLRTFPIDSIKIDRSFVGDLDSQTEQDPLVGAVIAMGHGLGLQVVAEGVETTQQLAFLLDHGCDAAQGYLLSRPIHPEELQELMSEAHEPSPSSPEPSSPEPSETEPSETEPSSPEPSETIDPEPVPVPAPAPALNDNDGDRAIRKIVADLQRDLTTGLP